MQNKTKKGKSNEDIHQPMDIISGYLYQSFLLYGGCIKMKSLIKSQLKEKSSMWLNYNATWH